MDRDDDKPPRKGSGAWIVWMIERGSVLKGHRSSPAFPIVHDLFTKRGEATDTVPVTDITVSRLVESGKLKARPVAVTPGCYDLIEYRLP